MSDVGDPDVTILGVRIGDAACDRVYPDIGVRTVGMIGVIGDDGGVASGG